MDFTGRWGIHEVFLHKTSATDVIVSPIITLASVAEVLSQKGLYIVASHLTWGSVITVAVGHTNGGLGDCGLPTLQGAYETSFNNYSLTYLTIGQRRDLGWAATIYPSASVGHKCALLLISIDIIYPPILGPCTLRSNIATSRFKKVNIPNCRNSGGENQFRVHDNILISRFQ